MGPYYRNTLQGMGSFFEMFYEHPMLMVDFCDKCRWSGCLYLAKKKVTGTTTSLTAVWLASVLVNVSLYLAAVNVIC